MADLLGGTGGRRCTVGRCCACAWGGRASLRTCRDANVCLPGMWPPRPRRVGAARSCPADCEICGVFGGEESVHRRRNAAAAHSCCPGGNRSAWLPSSVRMGSRGELDHEQPEGGDKGAGDQPWARRVQPAMVWPRPRAGSLRRVSGPRVVCAAQGAVGTGDCCRVLLGLERAHDLLGGGSVSNGALGCVAAVEVPVDLQLGERRAVDGEVVGQAERERGEVLVRLADTGRGGHGRSGLALLAASASVFEGPRAVGTPGDWSVTSAVVSHHRHPSWNSTTTI